MDTIQFPIPVNPGFSLRESRNQTTDKQMSGTIHQEIFENTSGDIGYKQVQIHSISS